MKLTGLLSRTHEVLPGVTDVARVDRRADDLLRRIGPGDIAVLALRDRVQGRGSQGTAGGYGTAGNAQALAPTSATG